MADPAVGQVPLQGTLELGPVVGLDDLYLERELLEDVVEELDRGLKVVVGIDPQHADPGAVIDRGVLLVLLAGARQRLDELHVRPARGGRAEASRSVSSGRYAVL